MTATILIIDDTPDIIKMIRQVLLAEKYQTLVATSGEKGIEIALNEKPDLILLDIMMPGKDGYETCKEIKENRTIRHIPVIFISALDSTFDKVKAFNIGAIDYVPKPIQEEELLARIKTHLANSKYENVLNDLNKKLIANKNELAQTLKSLKETQEQLIQSEKMASLGILTGGIAHEINNPITFVFAGINTLKENYDEIEAIIREYEELNSFLPIEKQKEILKIKEKHYYSQLQKIIPQTISDIYIGAERITEIVEGLGLFLHKQQKETKEADINKIVDIALLLLVGKYKDKVDIIKNYDKKLDKINCFPGELNQVFINIIDNAIDSLSENGKIIITTKKVAKKSEVQISIKDNGSGISNDIKSKILDPFFTTKEIGKGTGLGLYISFEIMKKHKGKILINSKLDEGSEFIIQFPSNL